MEKETLPLTPEIKIKRSIQSLTNALLSANYNDVPTWFSNSLKTGRPTGDEIQGARVALKHALCLISQERLL